MADSAAIEPYYSDAEVAALIDPSGRRISASEIDAEREARHLRGTRIARKWVYRRSHALAFIESWRERNPNFDIEDEITEPAPQPPAQPSISQLLSQLQKLSRPNSIVYFIRAGLEGPIKIGTARDVQKRLRLLRTGNHEPLHLLATTQGGYAAERLLQAYFKLDRLRGEWFRPTTALLDLVMEINRTNRAKL